MKPNRQQQALPARTLTFHLLRPNLSIRTYLADDYISSIQYSQVILLTQWFSLLARINWESLKILNAYTSPQINSVWIFGCGTYLVTSLSTPEWGAMLWASFPPTKSEGGAESLLVSSSVLVRSPLRPEVSPHFHFPHPVPAPWNPKAVLPSPPLRLLLHVSSSSRSLIFLLSKEITVAGGSLQQCPSSCTPSLPAPQAGRVSELSGETEGLFQARWPELLAPADPRLPQKTLASLGFRHSVFIWFFCSSASHFHGLLFPGLSSQQAPGFTEF